ncbi:hypothetical protein ASC93_24020 [Massilia sp. Root335]|nr:hypothetical protein ASC93_24020 [Massilia sp. Root335]
MNETMTFIKQKVGLISISTIILLCLIFMLFNTPSSSYLSIFIGILFGMHLQQLLTEIDYFKKRK